MASRAWNLSGKTVPAPVASLIAIIFVQQDSDRRKWYLMVSSSAKSSRRRAASLTIPRRARVRARGLVIVEFRGFSARSVPSGDVARMFSRLHIKRPLPWRVARHVERPRCGRRTRTSRSRLRSFNRCAARLAPRAERSAWSWTSTLEIRPDLENDEIADWRRRGHRDAAARCGARILSPSLGASAMLDRLPVLGQPAPHALDQRNRIRSAFRRRHLTEPGTRASPSR